MLKTAGWGCKQRGGVGYSRVGLKGLGCIEKAGEQLQRVQVGERGCGWVKEGVLG